MAVSNQSIIDKMKQELRNAEEQHDEGIMRQHISRVQLLCDLFLQEEITASNQQPEMTAEEMKAMLGETLPSKRVTQQPRVKYDHGNANGSSIFDF